MFFWNKAEKQSLDKTTILLDLITKDRDWEPLWQWCSEEILNYFKGGQLFFYVLKENNMLILEAFHSREDKEAQGQLPMQSLSPERVSDEVKISQFNKLDFLQIPYQTDGELQALVIIGPIIHRPNKQELEWVTKVAQWLAGGWFLSYLKIKNRQVVAESSTLASFNEAVMITLSHAIAKGQIDYEELLISLVEEWEAKDPNLKDHSKRVAELVTNIAHKLNLSKEEIEHLHLAGLLHDVGTIAVSWPIIQKKGALKEEEYMLIRQHPLLGAQLVKSLDAEGRIALLVGAHHERYDGYGYPRGCKGDEIPIGAHILHLAEVFVAQTTQRAYRNALTIPEAIDFCKKGKGQEFHPKVVEALEKCF